MTQINAQLREQMKRRERAISPGDRRAATNAIVDTGADFLASTGLKTVAGFFPTGTQITPLLLLNALNLRQLPLALPKRHEDGTIRFHKWTPGDKMTVGEHDIPCLADCHTELKPDYLLVPVLAFDGMGNRLGYGHGFYREAINDLRSTNPQAKVVGVGFDDQQLVYLIDDDNDGRLDWMITEAGVRGLTQ